jgi:hypothetical protein
VYEVYIYDANSVGIHVRASKRVIMSLVRTFGENGFHFFF